MKEKKTKNFLFLSIIYPAWLEILPEREFRYFTLAVTILSVIMMLVV